MADFAAWIGREQRRSDVIVPWPARALAAALDREPPGPGDPLPPAFHWAYFLDAAPAGELGRDGHPERGSFLPPVDLPRRMWAGGRLRFAADLPIGAEAERRSTILDVTEKSGRSGRLAFVTVRHEISAGGRTCIEEEHDIVYREDPRPGAPAPEPPRAEGDAHWSRRIVPDTTLLFRYSALTFNGHRIHYDQTYAREVEGYPGLVVHGPLIATLLLDLARREGFAPVRFAFRATAPCFCNRPLELRGRPDGEGLRLWAVRDDGALAMSAEAA